MMLTQSLGPAPRSTTPGRAVLRATTAKVRGFVALLRIWRTRARERHELTQLTQCELGDFGASRSDAIAEARKPFWRS